MSRKIKGKTHNCLPAGSFFSRTCCGDCQCGDYDSIKDMVWCGKDHKWYKKSDGCSRV
jgi:hypothetical protein